MRKKIAGIDKIFIIILLISFISFSCIESPLEPVGPTYDVNISVPVLDTTNYFSEFADINAIFQFNADDNTYTYRIPPIPEEQIKIGEFIVEGLSESVKSNSIIDGIINYEFTNRIPAEMSFRISFIKWNSALIKSDTLFSMIPDSLIKAPDLDSNGLAINQKTSNIAIFLTGPQLELMIKSDSILVKLYCHSGTELNSARFRSGDYIRTRTALSGRCVINKPQ